MNKPINSFQQSFAKDVFWLQNMEKHNNDKKSGRCCVLIYHFDDVNKLLQSDICYIITITVSALFIHTASMGNYRKWLQKN